jgi:thymidylate synthase
MHRPITFCITNPRGRVLYCHQRKANPYFHVMETVWMFAGSKDATFLTPFNSNMNQYMEPDGTIHGAYGHRWRNHFHRDQILWAIRTLQEDPESRQVVIGMYDPHKDHFLHWKDRPCNTHIYFRIVNGALDMTVCNRSNDVVWGACGANVVHMTYLQELVASGLKIPMGTYWVMSNNIHIYQHHWGLLGNPLPFKYDADPLPLMGQNESDPWELLQECELFVQYATEHKYKSSWINKVVVPMYEHYQCRLNGDKDSYDTAEVEAEDWRVACDLWREWHQ